MKRINGIIGVSDPSPVLVKAFCQIHAEKSVTGITCRCDETHTAMNEKR
jgi:hypothetical protein